MKIIFITLLLINAYAETERPRPKLNNPAEIVYGKGALEKIQNELKKDPKNSEVKFALADAYYLAGKFKESKNLLEELLKSNFKEAKVYKRLGQINVKGQKWKEAESNLTQAGAKDSNFKKDPFFMSALGFSFWHLDKKDQAYEKFNEALKTATRMEVVALEQAEFLVNVSDHKAAQEKLNLLKDKLATHPRYLFSLGKLSYMTGKKAQAK